MQSTASGWRIIILVRWFRKTCSEHEGNHVSQTRWHVHVPTPLRILLRFTVFFIVQCLIRETQLVRSGRPVTLCPAGSESLISLYCRLHIIFRNVSGLPTFLANAIMSCISWRTTQTLPMWLEDKMKRRPACTESVSSSAFPGSPCKSHKAVYSTAWGDYWLFLTYVRSSDFTLQ